MSDYSKYKVLRYPITEDDRDRIEEMKDYAGYRQIKNCGYFETTGTDSGTYLDYVLEHSYGEECGEYGKIRDLAESEKVGFKHLFAQLFPDIDMNKVRLVEYCWYNCCEPPDYYAPQTDPFYKTLIPPTAVWIEPYPGVSNNYLKCSKCGNEVVNDETITTKRFCSTCGAIITNVNSVSSP